MEIEAWIRVAIRDAVNRPSRKPFYWGGLRGYEQPQAVAQALRSVPPEEPGTGYLQRLALQVERALKKNHTLAQDVREAHTWLRRIAECLRYPPSSYSTSDTSATPLTSEQVRREMEELLQQFRPDLSAVQRRLHSIMRGTVCGRIVALICCIAMTSQACRQTTWLWSLYSDGFAAISAASADANLPANCGTSDNIRSCSWPKVRRTCCNNSVRFRWPSIKPAAFAWPKPKLRVGSFTVCIATR